MNSESIKRSALDADETDALQAIGWHPATDGTSCPDSSLLLAAEDGVLDDAVAARVRAHVTSCATCQLLAKDLAIVFAEDSAEAAVAGVRARIDAGRNRARQPAAVWVGLGGLALAAGLVWFFVMPRPSPPPAPDLQLARATPPPAPSVFVVDRPAIPPGDVDLTVRGESPVVSLPNQIANALDVADKGDLAAAESQLATIVRKSPASRSAGLALGAVQVRADKNADAVVTLERARSLKSDPEMRDETDWFLSIALVRTGNRDRARTLLDGVCRHGGVRSARACAGLTEIDRTSPR